jgi:hypothetical protein
MVFGMIGGSVLAVSVLLALIGKIIHSIGKLQRRNTYSTIPDIGMLVFFNRTVI